MSEWAREKRYLTIEVCNHQEEMGVFYKRSYTDSNSENKRYIRNMLEQMSEDSALWLTRFCRIVCNVVDERIKE